MTLSPGTTLGSFQISALLGAGGKGEVYRARDTKLGREVAIKVLPEKGDSRLILGGAVEEMVGAVGLEPATPGRLLRPLDLTTEEKRLKPQKRAGDTLVLPEDILVPRQILNFFERDL